MGKPIKTHILAQWNMIGYRLFASEPIRNFFYLHAVIFVNSKVVFYNKTICLLWRGCFDRDLWVVPCSNLIFFQESSKCQNMVLIFINICLLHKTCQTLHSGHLTFANIFQLRLAFNIFQPIFQTTRPVIKIRSITMCT